MRLDGKLTAVKWTKQTVTPIKGKKKIVAVKDKPGGEVLNRQQTFDQIVDQLVDPALVRSGVTR